MTGNSGLDEGVWLLGELITKIKLSVYFKYILEVDSTGFAYVWGVGVRERHDDARVMPRSPRYSWKSEVVN